MFDVVFFFLFVDLGCIFVGGNYFYDNWYVVVVFVVQFGILVVIGVFFVGFELGVMDEVWYGILFDGKCWYCLGMDYIVGCGQNVYFGVNWYDQWVIYCYYVVVGFVGLVVNLFFGCGDDGQEFNVFVFVFEVVVILFLLVVGCFDGDFGFGCIFYVYQCMCCGDGNQDQNN